MLCDRKRSFSDLSYTQNNDCHSHPREYSLDVIDAETFFKMEKRVSAHSEMSMKFVKK